ncbi:MAG: FHA domain-containing protein [Pseudanabaena sp. ELA645]|jgi:pSer/pThr/pTyr-binding forkhead associated (FHA) protein
MSETQVSHTLLITDAKGSRKLVLDGLKYTIGRDVNNNIQLYSRFVSRHHAVLLRVPEEGGKYLYRIIDGDLAGKPSVNGVIINHYMKIPSSYDLRNGDVIILAPNVELTYLITQTVS